MPAAVAISTSPTWRTLAAEDDVVHIVAGMALAFALPVAQALEGIALGALVVVALLRLPVTLASARRVLADPVAWLVLAGIAWHLLTLAWSPDRAQGFDEFEAARAWLIPLALAPILHRWPFIVAAALAGVAAQNLCQGLQAIGVLSIDSDDAGRLPGLLHPIQTGAWCAVAAALHLAIVLRARGRIALISTLGLVVALLGLLATGSRGPWIAASVALPAVAAVVLLRRPATRRRAARMAIAGAAVIAVAVPVLGGRIAARFREGVRGVQAAVASHDVQSSGGHRLAMARWALDEWRAHPLLGVGAGGYRARLELSPDFLETKRELEDQPKKLSRAMRDHCHSTPLQIAATTGVPGIALFAALAGTLLARAFVAPAAALDDPAADGWAGWLLAWLVGALFDCYHLNASELGMLALAATALLAARPPVRWRPGADPVLAENGR